MNEIATKIGAAIYTFFAGKGPALLQVLSIVGLGMLGIFAVTLVIIGVVTLLNKLGSK